MLDHIGIEVENLEKSKAFYKAALAPLGCELIVEVQGWAGFGAHGPDGKADFWITGGKQISPRIHLAFGANSRDNVRAFYEAAMKAGAKNNGPPAIREMYHPDYFGAFVIDPDGHNIEAVCHQPE